MPTEQTHLFDAPFAPGEPVAHARATDPETSHQAAQTVVKLRERQKAVLETFKAFGPLSHEELIEKYGLRYITEQKLPLQTVSGIRTRCSELVKLGRVIDTGKRKRTSTGRLSIVWGAA